MSKTDRLYILITCLIIFVLLSLLILYCPAINKIEVEAIRFIQKIFKWVNINVILFITHFGHGINWIISVLASILILLICKKFKATLFFIFTILSSQYIYSAIKLIIERPRPPFWIRLIDMHGYSFPSGHSTLSMITYGFLIYLVYKHVNNSFARSILIFLLSLLIILVGFSRIVLGVHYPTDVIGGFTLGISIICLLTILYDIEIRNPFKG
ncbi:MAG: phosphatase PAP2 family protein [Cyanobacteria bacterium SIG29]|nr:phosphatase PAP2 family protein [Cyanobacteria bacterium SIG29]